MRIRNTTQRNIRLLASYQFVTNDDGSAMKDAQGNLLKQSTGAPYRVVIPAGASLELKDTEWNRLKEAAKHLVKLGHLLFLERPSSPLTKPQMLNRIKRKSGTTIDTKFTKEKIAVKAEQLGVDVWYAYTDEEVGLDEAKNKENIDKFTPHNVKLAKAKLEAKEAIKED